MQLDEKIQMPCHAVIHDLMELNGWQLTAQQPNSLKWSKGDAHTGITINGRSLIITKFERPNKMFSCTLEGFKVTAVDIAGILHLSGATSAKVQREWEMQYEAEREEALVGSGALSVAPSKREPKALCADALELAATA